MRIEKISSAGWARVDLLGMVVTLTLLSMLSVASYSSTKTATKGAACMRNLSQFTKAWAMNAADNQGTLLLPQGQMSNRVTWLALTTDETFTSRWRAITNSPLMPYLGGEISIWKCPADSSTIRDPRGRPLPAPRSYSMSDVFGSGFFLPRTYWRTYEKIDGIVQPSKTWTFMEEHPDSLNDGSLVLEMTRPVFRSAYILDYPGTFHHGACALTFADGHTELHRWKGKRIQQRVTGFVGGAPAGDSLPDMKWWSERTTVSIRTGTWE